MKMFSDCAGGCGDCAISYSGGCIAGHGDNDFVPMTHQIGEELMSNPHFNDPNRIKRITDRYPDLVSYLEMKRDKIVDVKPFKVVTLEESMRRRGYTS